MLNRQSNRDRFQPFRTTQERGSSNMEIILLLAFIGVWFALQIWILPRFGVST